MKRVLTCLNHERFSGGPAAGDGFRDVVSLSSSLVVQCCSSDGSRPGKLNDPVAVEVVLATQVLNSWPCINVTVNA